VPAAIGRLLAEEDGLFASACVQYRESMNDVADWAKARGLVDHTGDECVPATVSLFEAHEHVPPRVALLQRRDGLGVVEAEPAERPPLEDAEALLREVPILTMTRGAVLGAMALLTGDPRAATARAHDGALVYQVARPFRRAPAREPAMDRRARRDHVRAPRRARRVPGAAARGLGAPEPAGTADFAASSRAGPGPPPSAEPLRSLRRMRVPILAGLAAALVALPLLIAGDDDFRYGLAARNAERAALRSDEVRSHLRGRRQTRVEVTPLDAELQRVSFFDGQRLVLDAAVDESGRTRAVAPRVAGTPVTGSEIAHSPLLWAALVATLVAALARTRVQLADTVAIAGFLGAVWAYNEAYVAAVVWLGAAPLVYLGIRAGQVARCGVARHDASGEPGAARLAALGCAAGLVLVSLTSSGESDVAFASLAGATLLNDGVSPYGNMPPEVVHGDTYPVLNYVLHMPAAAWLPVRDSFSDMTGALFVATAAALLAAWGIHHAARRWWDDTTAWRLALAWLAFPPVWIATSSGTNDLLAAAAVAWALALLAHAGRAAAILAAGAWVKVTPLLLLPLWLARADERSRPRALVAASAVTVACLTVLIALGGVSEIGSMLDALAFQAERGSLYSVWAQLDAEWAQHLARAATVGVVIGAAVLASRSRELRGDPVRIAALAAVVLACVQLSASYWTFAYLPWLLPPLLLSLFAPRPAASPGARAA